MLSVLLMEIHMSRNVEHFTIFPHVILKLLYLSKWTLTKKKRIKDFNGYLSQLEKKDMLYILNNFSFTDVLVS